MASARVRIRADLSCHSPVSCSPAFLYLKRPDICRTSLKQRFAVCYRLLDNKYYLDRINEVVFAAGARKLGFGLWRAAMSA